MSRLRACHALLAVLAVAAYLVTEPGRLHAWLGYGVAAAIALRLVLALTGAPQLGLMRFYPHFKGLRLDNAFAHPAISRTLLLGIAISLIGAAGTGIALDGGRALGLGPARPNVAAADPGAAAAPAVRAADRHDDEAEEAEEGLLGEAHELFANALMLLVLAHVAYLLAFKRPLARFMIFASRPPPA
jgi:cytochrome b